MPQHQLQHLQQHDGERVNAHVRIERQQTRSQRLNDNATYRLLSQALMIRNQRCDCRQYQRLEIRQIRFDANKRFGAIRVRFMLKMEMEMQSNSQSQTNANIYQIDNRNCKRVHVDASQQCLILQNAWQFLQHQLHNRPFRFRFQAIYDYLAAATNRYRGQRFGRDNHMRLGQRSLAAHKR